MTRSAYKSLFLRFAGPTQSVSVHVARTSRSSAFRAALLRHPQSKHICTSKPLLSSILPTSADPLARENPRSRPIDAPVALTIEKYHELADDYLSRLQDKLELLQERNENIDVEFSAGVLTLVLPPKGTYVLNKQPPNKQIWLSSPITGPKRYDYVMLGERQDSKEGTGRGEWVYLRDGSKLTDVLEHECEVVMDEGIEDL